MPKVCVLTVQNQPGFLSISVGVCNQVEFYNTKFVQKPASFPDFFGYFTLVFPHATVSKFKVLLVFFSTLYTRLIKKTTK